MKKLLLSSLLVFTSAIVAMASGHVATTTHMDATCNGMCNGTADGYVTGGIGPYGYSWSGPGSYTASTQNITGLCAGNYTLTVIDSSDMSTATANAVIIEPSLLAISLPPSYSTCGGATCVTLVGTVTGGTAAYTYNWMPMGTGFFATPTVCPTTPTTYTLTVTDNNGCVQSATTTVAIGLPITTGITSTHTSSCGACDGTASVFPTGGSGPYTYMWSSGFTLPSPGSLCTGTYSVTVTDINGCTANDSIKVLGPPITADFTMVPDSSNSLNYWGFDTSTGAGLSYIWYFGDGDSSFVRSPTHLYAAAGTYNVCLIVSVPGGCFDVKCTTITVNSVPDACLSLFNITHDTASTNPNAYTVYNLSYGSPLTYLWDFGDGTTSTLRDPMHVYSGTGSYQICLTVDNGSGCSHMYCDSLAWADSISRAAIPLSVTVVDGPPFPSATGIAEHTSASSIDVFPNPFTDITTFEIRSANQNEAYSFELTDVLGKKVRIMNELAAKQFQLSRNGLENGVYFYKIYSAEKVIGIGKLVIK